MTHFNENLLITNDAEEAIQNLYLDIKWKISDGDILIIDQEKEKLKDINIQVIAHYLGESINILINKKLEEGVRKFEKDFKKKLKNEDRNAFATTLQEDYEKIICKLEADVRGHIRTEYQMKLNTEYLESKLQDYDEMIEQIEKMQRKIEKYEHKISANDYSTVTDKKENEILILRAENSNLKNMISSIEKKLTEAENKISANKKQYEKDLSVNLQIIEKLNRKIHNYEKVLKSSNSNGATIGNGLKKEESKESLSLNLVN
jgi:hypothetical protein